MKYRVALLIAVLAAILAAQVSTGNGPPSASTPGPIYVQKDGATGLYLWALTSAGWRRQGDGAVPPTAGYWVSTTGSDSNPGTFAAPWRHLSKAAAVATHPGDIVTVMDGTYDNEGVIAPNFVATINSTGTAVAPITFQAQNRGAAILDSGNTVTDASPCNGASAYFNIANSSYLVIQGFVMQHACDGGLQANGSAHHVTIRWNEIRYIANRIITDQIGRDGVYLNAGEHDFNLDGNTFHNIGRVSGQALNQFDHGIYAAAQNVTISNNTFYSMTKGWPITQSDGAANWLVAFNTFYGSSAGVGQMMLWNSVTGITIRNNIFYLPTTAAITRYTSTANGCTVDHNIVWGVSLMMSDATGCNVDNTNKWNVNPLLVNAPAFDFHLTSASPAIGAGLSVPAVTIDHDGRTRKNPPSIGAYE